MKHYWKALQVSAPQSHDIMAAEMYRMPPVENPGGACWRRR
jgi:hypothetical protein